MGTLTITASGFSGLGSTPPADWPSLVTFPANGNPNGTKTYTVSDADWLALLTYQASLIQPSRARGGATSLISVSAPQLLLNWVQGWINSTITNVAAYMQQPPPPVTPISIQ